MLRDCREEYARRGGFVRIFPSHDSWDLYRSAMAVCFEILTLALGTVHTDSGYVYTLWFVFLYCLTVPFWRVKAILTTFFTLNSILESESRILQCHNIQGPITVTL